MRRYPAVLVVAPLLLVACGDDGSPATTTSDDDSDQLYTTTATVLESPDHGPQLCLGGVAESYPPQCGGPDIDGWTWEEAEGHESESGTTWGTFTVVGTYADGVFTLAEPPTPPDPDQPVGVQGPQFTTPCPEPDDGWQVRDEATATNEAMNDAIAYAEAQAEFAGAYVDQSINPALGDDDMTDEEVEGAANDPTKQILNVRFTGDIERHDEEIRKLWGGALCVSLAEVAEDELRSIQDELTTDYSDFLSAGVDVTTGRVNFQVIADDGGLQAELDERYGAGVVVVHSALKPVG